MPVQVVNVSLWVINTIRNWLKAQNLTKVLVSNSVYSCRGTNMKEIKIFSVLYLLCTSGIFSIYLDCWYILTSHLIGCTFPELVGSHFSPRLHDTYHTAAMHISAWNLLFRAHLNHRLKSGDRWGHFSTRTYVNRKARFVSQLNYVELQAVIESHYWIISKNGISAFRV